VSLEEIGRLDDVIVDTHQNQIVSLHGGLPGPLELAKAYYRGLRRSLLRIRLVGTDLS
jgi:hypothetical protein